MVLSQLLSACFRAWFGPTPAVAEAEATSLVLMADGCGGIDLCERSLTHVIGRASRTCLVRPVHWGHGLGRWHADLTDVPNLRAWSRVVAGQVLDWRAAHPDAPVSLVGKSGGAGVIVGALELLPEASVATVVLLAPALSPGYDLSNALQAVAGSTFSFWSPLDLIILGAGTRVFGTIDRVRSVAAGLVGFLPPPGLDDAALSRYTRLVQVRWRPSMARTGYLGGHVGPDSPAFLRKYVVPLLIDPGGLKC